MVKRPFLLATVASATLWYTGVALATTGHTKLLWGGHRAVKALLVAGSRTRGAIHRLEGDSGSYVIPR